MSLPTSANLSLSQINGYARFTNGNVGIGTTAPAYKLDVIGNVNATSLLQSGSALTSSSTFNGMVTYNTTATLTATTPTDIEVSGQIGDVTIALPANNTSGNTITIHNVGGTTGSTNSSVFVRMGTSTTSGSLARLRQGESVTTIALQTAGTTPRTYQETIFRKAGEGLKWTDRAIPNTRSWRSLCWAPELGLFCAVNQNSAAFVMTSPDGITWTERSIPNSRTWNSVCWAPELGLFCAICTNAAFVMTSPDGITWTERSIPNSYVWWNVCWAPELRLFCATNYTTTVGQNYVMTSPDGITWTERSIPNPRLWISVCWAPELMLFCAVNRGTAAFVMTSPDGTTWTERAIPTNRTYRSVCWAPELGLFCAICSDAFVITSPDGTTWTERAIPNARTWWNVCWAPELGLFCAVVNSSTAGQEFVMTSPDGITWTERAIPNARSYTSVCWAPELMTFCAVNSSAAVVMTSFGLLYDYNITNDATALSSVASLTNQPVTVSADDTFIEIPLGFSFPLSGFGNYTSVFVGSNSFVTFGAGSNEYGNYTSSNPNTPTLFIGAGDFSYQRVYYQQNLGSGRTNIRYEGTDAQSGTPGSPNITWELVLYTSGDMLLIVGSHAAAASGYSKFSRGNGSDFTISGISYSTISSSTGYYFNRRD